MRQLRQRHCTAWRFNQQTPQPFKRPAVLGQSNHQIETAIPIDDLRNLAALDHALQIAQQGTGRKTITGDRIKIQTDLDLWRQDLFFDFKIGCRRNAGRGHPASPDRWLRRGSF